MQPEPARRTTSTALDVKVLAAVASLVILLVIAIAMAVVLIATIGHNANLAERQARYGAAIDSAALWSKALANDERGYLISGDAEFLSQIETRTDLARAAYNAAAEAANAEQRSTVAEAREGFERWLEILDEEVATYQAGNEEAAVESSLGQSRVVRKAYEGWLADAKSLGVAAFQDATSSVATASSLSILILVGYLVVATIIGVAIALWVVRTVLRPTYALARLLADADEETRPTPA
jgi:methyl-accepting chemotaxis protein